MVGHFGVRASRFKLASDQESVCICCHAAVVISLREGDRAKEFILSDAVGERLRSSELVGAVRLRTDVWEVAPLTKVGVIRIGDVTVRIEPKVAIDQLLFLISFAVKITWSEGLVGVGEHLDLVSMVAHTFVRHAERVVEAGLLQGYREIDDSSAVLRGRIRETDQLRTSFGIAPPLCVRYDDYTTDIVENQLLRAAARALLRLHCLDPMVVRQLRGLDLVFGEISALPGGRTVPTWAATRLNERYRFALWLAELILRSTGVSSAIGDVQIRGFIVDMTKVFEGFVCRCLGDALAPIGGQCALQSRHAMDEAGIVVLRPDLVWLDLLLRPRAVVDAKYKAEKPSGFPNADYTKCWPTALLCSLTPVTWCTRRATNWERLTPCATRVFGSLSTLWISPNARHNSWHQLPASPR